MRRPVRGPTLATLGADQLGHLELHHLRRDGLDRLADHVGVLIEQHLPDDLLDRHPVGTGHAAPPFVRAMESPTIFSPRRPEPRSVRPRPTPRYGTSPRSMSQLSLSVRAATARGRQRGRCPVPSVTTMWTASQPRISSSMSSRDPSALAWRRLSVTSSPARSGRSRVRSSPSSPSRWLAGSPRARAGAVTPLSRIAAQTVVVRSARRGAVQPEPSLPDGRHWRRSRGRLAGAPGIPGCVLVSVLVRADGWEERRRKDPTARPAPPLSCAATGPTRTRVPRLSPARWPVDDRVPGPDTIHDAETGRRAGKRVEWGFVKGPLHRF
jgi:hypothetical protein